ncbi:endonuclease domain-containing protein [Algoriphagus sp. AGSA1]|nr:endonuclease domain-containing protein [Algoriphagus sp. AGSA1]
MRPVIELDGEVQNDDDQREHDINRDADIKEYAIHTLRFKNEEILNELPNIQEWVRSYISNLNQNTDC